MSAGRIAGLYAITDEHLIPAGDLAHRARLALAGGASVLQYRSKSTDPVRRHAQALQLSRLCQELGAVFIVNDDVALACAVDASGVHLGRDDTDPQQARRLLGEGRLIGVSCYDSLQRAVDAEAAGADYVAFGSFFPSPTKPLAVRAPPELLRRAKTRLRLPLVAIGGITRENAESLLRAGADALAVIHAVFGQRNIRAAARALAALFQGPTTASPRAARGCPPA